MNYMAIIGILLVIITFLLYISASNKGWNCTENGCAYVSGGTFSSYDKCNSYCKSSSKEPEEKNNSVNPVYYQQPYPYLPMGYYHPSLYYHDNYWNRREHNNNRDSGGINNHNENNIIISSPTGPN